MHRRKNTRLSQESQLTELILEEIIDDLPDGDSYLKKGMIKAIQNNQIEGIQTSQKFIKKIQSKAVLEKNESGNLASELGDRLLDDN